MKLLLLAIAFLTIFDCSKKGDTKPTITIYAAASTSSFLNNIAKIYEQKNGVKVIINSASSGTLARQITSGAESDIYISASNKWITYLIERKAISKEYVSKPMRNRLVIVSSNNSAYIADSLILSTLLKGKLSIGDPTHVPSGRYAKQSLETLRMYDSLEHIIVPAASVSAALRVVEMKECDYGIVYSTDAKSSKKVEVVHRFADSLHNPIEYSVALVDTAEVNREFYEFFASEVADSLKEVYGFINVITQ